MMTVIKSTEDLNLTWNMKSYFFESLEAVFSTFRIFNCFLDAIMSDGHREDCCDVCSTRGLLVFFFSVFEALAWVAFSATCRTGVAQFNPACDYFHNFPVNCKMMQRFFFFYCNELLIVSNWLSAIKTFYNKKLLVFLT